ncbi:TPA: type I methionyl aminopeptidase [Candidatus Taylorbacteria bacterium]|nr:type I methionyl aminopeptidase [Candidatus Taylorbacteria bacterium]
MITIKTAEDITKLREGGKHLAAVLAELKKAAKVGVKTSALDALAEKIVRDFGDKPAFLNYKPQGAARPYPASLCVSINDEIVHGIPNENDRELVEGDIVSLDMGLVHEGMVVDSAITVGVGQIDTKAKKLLAATEEAMNAGIKAARGGKHIGDIGVAVEAVADRNTFSIADELAGHGVGYKVHEDPFVPNFGMPGQGPLLKPGMVIAIEPMLNEGGSEIRHGADGYTISTKDGSRSAHFEHTVLITEGAPEILTKI